MSVLCAYLRTCGFQDVPICLRGTEINTKHFSQGVLITWLYQPVASKIVMRGLLAEEGVRGGVIHPSQLPRFQFLSQRPESLLAHLLAEGKNATW